MKIDDVPAEVREKIEHIAKVLKEEVETLDKDLKLSHDNSLKRMVNQNLESENARLNIGAVFIQTGVNVLGALIKTNPDMIPPTQMLIQKIIADVIRLNEQMNKEMEKCSEKKNLH